MKLYIINGPNLNMLGIREPDIYGREDYAFLLAEIERVCTSLGIEWEAYQSNHEGDLVDKIQEAYFKGASGIVINPGAYTHTSVALLDALKSTALPAVEVHISRVEERESFRQVSFIRSACEKCITGMGIAGYSEAIRYLYERLSQEGGNES